jgi:endonuclease YncB( thermonuclease family)
MRSPRLCVMVWVIFVLVEGGIVAIDAHRSGCHRWHSCPSDRGTYVCGDLGYCSQCPDNEYCQGGKPRTMGQTPATPAKPGQPAPAHPQVANVTRVIDGDTLKLSTGEEVRLIGVDTPETKHPRKPVEYFGKEASAFTKQMVEGKEVRLEFDVQRKDKYKRTLAYVYVGETMLNAELIRQGYAQVATYPPNVKYQEMFLQLQRESREAGRGLWGAK